MNYSLPLAFQAQFGSQNNPYSSSNSFPQMGNPRLASMLYPMENFTQSPEALYFQKAMQGEENNEHFMYEPMKKIKTANSSDFALLNNQGNLLNQIQINEQIKNKGITSSYNPMLIAGPNHNFDPRFGANQPQESHKEINQNFFNNRGFGYDPNELGNSYLEQAKMMLQMQSNSAPMMRDQPMMRPIQMSSNNLLRAQQSQLASQINFLQNLEQQFLSSQKVLEQLQAKTFMANHGNAQSFSLSHFPQERQLVIDQQQSQDFRAMFEQGAQKVFGDFGFLKKNENTAPNTENPNAEFSELSFDPSLFADNFNFEGGLAFERPQSRPADDLDEKRTAETSACNADEILFSQMAELLPEVALFSGAETSKKASPLKKDESLLRKRRPDFIENEEAILYEKLDAGTKVKRGRPSMQNKVSSSVPQADAESSPNYDKPKIQSKVRKDKTSPKTVEYLSVQPQKRERRMNRLQSMRAAWDTYYEEQKKPYTIKLHVEPSDEEYSKLVETRKGQGFQAEIPTLEPHTQAPRATRLVKTMWNPNAIQSSKIQEFYSKLAEIYREEVRNEEAALMILRGTGMDVDSTIELIKNNGDYFKERLFTEPRPLKVQRAL